MSPEELSEALQHLMAAHGVPTTLQDGWLHSGDGLPALRGVWHPGPWPKRAGHLDVQVALRDGRTIEECFAGIGAEPEGSRDALKHFMISSLHVLLAALWKRDSDHTVTVETWTNGTATWKVFIGDFVRRFSHQDVEHPSNAFDVVQHAARSEPLSPGLHWIRTYFCDPGDGKWVIEALLDNDTWAAGIEAYSGLPWPSDKGFYSVRNFMIIEVPEPEAKKKDGSWSRRIGRLLHGGKS